MPVKTIRNCAALKAVKDENKLVVIAFIRKWCSASQNIAAEFEKLSNEVAVLGGAVGAEVNWSHVGHRIIHELLPCRMFRLLICVLRTEGLLIQRLLAQRLIDLLPLLLRMDRLLFIVT
ncbi:unnamed protein product [Vitrella brassicaformis CCMP3155]|uniref:Thioredoxin domain-containing protein n=1 Tax=Vitrella brassicaformis (strain CCMP3155) TaxID=1169540 RepID=A0A0G4EIC2_VITBC|nr:unnamed protein product [Vitrella brassicaformis CCMP3155]|eukprot:CEL95993.1 unnamed protein product [Vitrella brassicaformis CCMP3155]